MVVFYGRHGEGFTKMPPQYPDAKWSGAAVANFREVIVCKSQKANDKGRLFEVRAGYAFKAGTIVVDGPLGDVVFSIGVESDPNRFRKAGPHAGGINTPTAFGEAVAGAFEPLKKSETIFFYIESGALPPTGSIIIDAEFCGSP